VPKFKKKGRADSFTLDGSIRICGDYKIKVPKIGVLRTYERLPQTVSPKSLTISRQAHKWFISFKLEVTPQLVEKANQSVGVDLGIKHFATLSNGEIFDVPGKYQTIKHKIAKLQYLSRNKVKHSHSWGKCQNRIANLYYRLSQIRSDWLHKLTSYLAKTFKVICVEDLNVKGMMANHKLAGAIAELGWFEFRRQLEYKCQLYGSQLKIISRWEPSSKLHHKCDYKDERLTLSDRVFYCPVCDESIDRDLNAALNIERFGLSNWS
jgi:putative transposase